MILQVSNLEKSFGSTRVVDGVSFSVSQGENFSIIGESGCGKSTLAKIIMGLLRQDKGEVQVDRNFIQMVFQDPYSSLDPLWTVRSILTEALLKQKLTSYDQTQRLEGIFKAVGLTGDMLERFPHEFSGGQRQRIAIARALLADPKVLILDEAVSSLDILVQKQIMDLLKELKREFNLTYIFISHNLKIVKNFSDTIAVMHEGKIVEMGLAQEIFKQPKERYTQALMKAAFDYQL